MSNQISITFEYNDATTLNYGQIDIRHRDAQGRDNIYTVYPFVLTQTGPAATFKVTANDDAYTAQQFAFLFNTKFRASINGNFDQMFTRDGNVVNLIATQGEFRGLTYNGDVLNLVQVITDLEDPGVKSFSWGQDPFQRGDCSTTRWLFRSAFGGIPPLEIRDAANDNVLVDNWSGVTQEFVDFERGKLHTGSVFDSENTLIGSYNIFSPQNILSTDFTIETQQFINSNDVIVRQNIVRSNTGADLNADGSPASEGRINYAIAQVVTGEGIDLNTLQWQESNLFTGLAIGAFRLYIRDKYGCIVSKDLFITEFDPTEGVDVDGNEVYFTITELNSLSFANQTTFDNSRRGRKNYERTLGYQEHVRIPYPNVFYFEVGSLIQTQFKSSYPFHIITLYKCDGTRQQIPYTRIQENIATVESVSAKLFNYFDGQQSVIGVYFEGGSLFDTEGEKIGNSPYFQILPSWAVVDRTVEITTESGQSFGARTITVTNLFDSTRNTLFFTVEGQLGSDTDITDAIVTVRYNRHPYDVYRFDLEAFEGQGQVVIEAGFDQDNIDQNQIWCSELFRGIDFDTTDWLRIEWFLNRGVGEAAAYNSFTGILWIPGRMLPFAIGEAEVLQADDRTRSLNQVNRMGLKMDAKILAPRQWYKLLAATAIGNRGELIIQGENVVRINAPAEERIGLTNKSNIEIEFERAGETPRTLPEELVTDIGIGTGEPPQDVGNWKGWIRIVANNYQFPGDEITYLQVEHNGVTKFLVAGRAE